MPSILRATRSPAKEKDRNVINRNNNHNNNNHSSSSSSSSFSYGSPDRSADSSYFDESVEALDSDPSLSIQRGLLRWRRWISKQAREKAKEDFGETWRSIYLLRRGMDWWKQECQRMRLVTLHKIRFRFSKPMRACLRATFAIWKFSTKRGLKMKIKVFQYWRKLIRCTRALKTLYLCRLREGFSRLKRVGLFRPKG